MLLGNNALTNDSCHLNLLLNNACLFLLPFKALFNILIFGIYTKKNFFIYIFPFNIFFLFFVLIFFPIFPPATTSSFCLLAQRHICGFYFFLCFILDIFLFYILLYLFYSSFFIIKGKL